jgi:hypothetical protein
LRALPAGDLPTVIPLFAGTVGACATGGLKLEAGVVGCGVDGHRRAAGLETQLGHGAVDGLEAADDGVEGAA